MPQPDFKSLVNLVRSSAAIHGSVEDRRRTVAELCKLLGHQLTGSPRPTSPLPTAPPPKTFADALPPRRRAVLESLLRGKSEKEVARELGISAHTVHVHVKAIYKSAAVSSRAELLAKCLGQSER